MRCMCNEKLMRLIRDQAIIRPPKIFRVPNSQAKNVHPSWTKRAFKSFYSNQQLQFPIATVVVRWKQCHHLPNYDITGLRDTLSKCGEIVELKQMKPNVCVVTFKELSSACDVIQSRHIGEPINKLYCTWYHKAMENKFVYEDVKGISVKRNLFIQ
ncbi:hypothetical protein DPMN_084190 [Dreissena polymorpha]|uniref:RRM domain-containing protein n=1 Tax=Dreissena polymorpha TaxID=45954 RepID=A0A9D4BJ53_DREPO|nr:hypothetical protein DPMN_084190 [Dreissena polymorpha]